MPSRMEKRTKKFFFAQFTKKSRKKAAKEMEQKIRETKKLAFSIEFAKSLE